MDEQHRRGQQPADDGKLRPGWKPGFGRHTHTYVYDAENRTVQVDGNVSYTYDGHGNRIKKVTPTETVRYIYSVYGQMLAEYKATTHKNHLYFKGALVATQDQADFVRFLIKDYLGSTRKAWEIDPNNQWQTDQGGNPVWVWGSRSTLVEEYTYDPYGKPTASGAPPAPTRPLFTGKERDSESGLTCFGRGHS